MILHLTDEERGHLTLRDVVIVDTYRNNHLGFWCRYKNIDGTGNVGQFFVSEEATLQVYHA